MKTKALILAIFLLFTTSGAQSASIKAITQLSVVSDQKKLQSLFKAGYRCEQSGPTGHSNWHCLNQDRTVSFNHATVYVNCEALGTCHQAPALALRKLFKGKSRAIETFSIHDRNQSTRWHCLIAAQDKPRFCLKG